MAIVVEVVTLDLTPALFRSKHMNFVLCSLKMECEKLVAEKTEMQRQYVMVSILF